MIRVYLVDAQTDSFWPVILLTPQVS